jgi:hypothetical protein
MQKTSASLLAAGFLLLSGASSADACLFRLCARCTGRAYGNNGCGYNYAYQTTQGYGGYYNYAYPPYCYNPSWKEDSSKDNEGTVVVKETKVDVTVVNRLAALEHRVATDRLELESRITKTESRIDDKLNKFEKLLNEQKDRIDKLSTTQKEQFDELLKQIKALADKLPK